MLETIEQSTVAADRTETSAVVAGVWSPTISHLRPRLLGWIRAIAAVVALAVATALILIAPSGRKPALLIYRASLVELYAVSATFHLGRWRRLAGRWIRLADHASIFVAIAVLRLAFA